MTGPTHDKPLRADARRNREKLLAAAVGLFAERGTEGSLEEVAKRAGVGIGTLYRHFPTRDALQSIAGGGSDLFADTRAQVVEAVAVLLKAGAAAGTLRADVEPEDVLRAMGAIWLVAGDEHWADDATRVLRLVLDGLRYRA